MANDGNLTANTAGLETERNPGLGNQAYNTLAATGTFGSGTLKAQVGYWINGTMTWFDVPSASLTAAGVVTFAIAGDKLRIVLSGATSPNINWALR